MFGDVDRTIERLLEDAFGAPLPFDLSFAVPATAVTYVLETVLAKYVLKEHVNRLRWAGAGLVICGVALVSL